MMFRRMILDEGTAWVQPAVSFVLVFLVFALAVVRALARPRAEVERLAALPVEDEKGDRHA